MEEFDYEKYIKNEKEKKQKERNQFKEALKKFQNGELVIKELDYDNLNPYEDCRFSSNGGGYNQFSQTFDINGCVLIYEDTSCGQFGDRYSTEMGGYVYSYNGVDNLDDDDKEWSTFPKTLDVMEFLDAIQKKLSVQFYI